MQQLAKQHRLRMILLASLVAMLVAVSLFGNRTSSQFWLQVRILAVGLLTLGAAFYLVKGMKIGFSKFGGWRSAFGSLAWAASALIMAASELWKTSDPVPASYLSVLAGATALVAIVSQQREQERVQP
jgi:hypothetical protein